jgi:hypothetical protein
MSDLLSLVEFPNWTKSRSARLMDDVIEFATLISEAMQG